jgi:F420-non-reducing hydrogenase small subunit
MARKRKLAMYWAASCGGCEISLLNLHERLLEVLESFDLVFCPALLDVKRADVESMADGSIDLCLLNGAVRTEENLEMVRLLRRKASLLVAYGACAVSGAIPALSNLSGRAELERAVFLDSPSTYNHAGVLPRASTATPCGTIHLPVLLDHVASVAETVWTDYTLPGCPPEREPLWGVLRAVLSGEALPPTGAVLGGGRSSVCDQCSRKVEEKRISALRRFNEFIPDLTRCLLEQGLPCLGVVTRDGCGALCPTANVPCAGCYGAAGGIVDPGGKMIAALGSILDIERIRGLREEEMAAAVKALGEANPDWAGTLYKFCLRSALLPGRVG